MRHFLHFLQTIFLIFSFIFFTYTAQAQLANWRGEMPVTIHNNSGSTMTNCQVPMVFSTVALISSGLMLANGNDIRFGSDCGSTNAYSYWIEGYLNTDTTKIWVMVPSVNANDSVKLYMFFGNAAASAGSTLSIFNGPWSSTDSVSSGGPGGVGNSQRGFRFTANQDVLVTSFGKREPTGTQRYVTLFNFSTQAVVAQMQVSGPSAQYSYAALPNVIWLTSGTQYVLELFQGTSDGYYFGTSSQISPGLTYGDMKYCNSCTQNTFPTSTLTNYHYGYPDLLYYMKTSVTPAPTSTLGLPADTNTPVNPTNLQGIAGNQQATLRWNRNPDFDLAKYYILRNTSNNPGTATLIDSLSGAPPDTNYTATGLTNGSTYYFWVKAADRFCVPRISGVSNVATITPVAIANNQNALPKIFALHQNYPNPFNPVTKIKYDLPKGTIVKMTVYDLTGKEVDILVNEFLAAGFHEVSFDAQNYASGVYFYKIEAGTFTDKKKMIVLK